MVVCRPPDGTNLNLACLLLGELDLVWVHLHEGTNDGLLTPTVHGLHHEDRTIPGPRQDDVR